MNMSIRFPHLGISLPQVGKTITVFGFDIAYYGIVIAIAMIVGISIAMREARRTGQDPDIYLDMLMITMVTSVIGARIYYVAFSWENYKDDLIQIFNTRNGGLAIYGGIIAGIITVYVFVKIKKMNFQQVADTVCMGLITGQIIGRWGNFFNREAFGGYTDNLLAMQLPVSAVRQNEITAAMWKHLVEVNGVEYIQVHPTFLYEGLWNFMVLLFLLWYRDRKKFQGELFLCYLTGYGMGRFWIESLRTDQLLIPGIGLPVSQVLSAVVVIASVAMILWKRTGGSRDKECSNDKGRIKNTD
ncbi:MAG: prolipoprotein diacylglyceryl transferase [Firmicutes bacterium]|nr:prolipoprotein diacylglyceryl transferase [Blautia sp.]MDD7371271.1 prolipoprotein diacylglyceryl transferase [Bacillota bacterium]MDY3715888.1 prolipoprotein diacylglyceryl transferase [Blautia sp.]